MIIRFPTILLMLLLLCQCSGTRSEEPATTSTPVDEPHMRIVWVRDTVEANDTFARGSNLQIMGYDSRDNQVRTIVEPRNNYTKPMLMPDGESLVFSNRHTYEIFAVDFDGNNLRKLRDGLAIDTWRDPASGTDYVICGSGELTTTKYGVGFVQVSRFTLDQPRQLEHLWNSTFAHSDNFQLSRDGKRAAGLFPWPHAGIADFEQNSWRKIGSGCWTSMAPDDSYLAWIFDGPHKNLYLYDTRNHYDWKVAIGRDPQIGGFEIYHPRWSNHPHHFVFTGPYTTGGGSNKLAAGGTNVEIFLGSFNQDLTGVYLRQITDDTFADFFPDCWIEGGDDVSVREHLASLAAAREATSGPRVELANNWPGNTQQLQWLWQDASHNNLITTPDGTSHACNIRLDGKAFFARHHQLDLRGGMGVAENVGQRWTEAFRASNQLAVEFVANPARDDYHYARILSFSNGRRERNFTIGMHYDHLMAWIRTPNTGLNATNPDVTIAPIPKGRDSHVILSYRNNHLKVWINGELVMSSGTITGNFSNWAPMPFVIGDETTGGRPWTGTVEGIAIHSRAIDAEEARHRYQQYKQKLDAREAPLHYDVEARLIEISPTPAPADITPYRRCLVTGIYELVQDHEGSFVDEQFVGVHWGMLGGEVLPELQRQPGKIYRMQLEEYFEDRTQPQLKGERSAADNLTTPNWEEELPRYYDANVTP